MFCEPEQAHPSSHSAMTKLHAWSLHCDAHVKNYLLKLLKVPYEQCLRLTGAFMTLGNWEVRYVQLFGRLTDHGSLVF